MTITCPTESVDVNISPDKMTIGLHQEELLLQALQAELETLYGPAAAGARKASVGAGASADGCAEADAPDAPSDAAPAPSDEPDMHDHDHGPAIAIAPAPASSPAQPHSLLSRSNVAMDEEHSALKAPPGSLSLAVEVTVDAAVSARDWSRGTVGSLPAPVTLLPAAPLRRSELKRKPVGHHASGKSRRMTPETAAAILRGTMDTFVVPPRRVGLDMARIQASMHTLGCPGPEPSDGAEPRGALRVVGQAGAGCWVLADRDRLVALNFHRALERLLYAGMLQGHRLPQQALATPVTLSPDMV